MVVEKKTVKTDWTPKARRQGERPGWDEKLQPVKEPADEFILAPLTPPPIWPRVFPGL